MLIALFPSDETNKIHSQLVCNHESLLLDKVNDFVEKTKKMKKLLVSFTENLCRNQLSIRNIE